MAGRPKNPITSTGCLADFAAQLRHLRAHAGLTLRQLSERAGYSVSTLSEAEKGEDLPSPGVVRAFVKACGADPVDWQQRRETTEHLLRLPLVHIPERPAPRTPERRRAHRALAGPAPLPVPAETPGEFMDCLLRVKIWAGDPPVRALARLTGVPASTMQDFLTPRKGKKLPPIEMVCDFLTACGIYDENVLAEWNFAWRRLKYDETGTRRKARGRGRLRTA